MREPARGVVPALLAAGCAPLAAYVWALHPGLAAGDSGELVTAAATHGVAHPPGYPLYVLAGGAWLQLWRHASPAWALNLFSAVCMAAAAAVLAGAVRRARGSWLAGVFAAWLFAACPPVFTNALVAEVFALHALLSSLALLALCSTPAAGAVALAILGTLALSLHHTLVLLALPGFVACAWRALRPRDGRVRLVFAIVFAALVGLVPLLWLPFAARHAGALVWGEPTTLKGFVSLLLRAEYGTFRLDPLAAGHTASTAQLVAFARALPAQLTWAGLVLAAIGAWRISVTRPEAAAALGVTLALQASFFTRIGYPVDVPWLIGVVERFQILPLLVLVFLAGRGSVWAVTQVARGGRAQVFVFSLLLILVFALGVSRARALHQRGNQLVAALGRGVLASVPKDGVLFTRGDVLHNAITYLQRIEHVRPDVIALDEELMAYPWYVRRLRARHPDLLPPLDLAQRITLDDGSSLEGVALRHGDGTTDLLTEDGQRTVASATVVRITPTRAESLYAATRARFRRAPWLDAGEDRYSGLPGSRNLLWFDALVGAVPVCVIGTKDSSYTLRYSLEPRGFAQLVRPRGTPVDEHAVLGAALAAFEAADPAVYFRPQLPTSLEQPERARFANLVTDAALLLAKAGGAPASAAHTRVLDFAQAFEPLEPTPDPACLRAIGFLRVFDPAFKDAAAAERDLERALSATPDPEADTDAQRVLAMLKHAPR
jgi:hypothetical protein